MNFSFSGRRRHGSRLRATGIRPRLTVAAAALSFLIGCASSLPPAPTTPGSPLDPGVVASVLSACSGADPRFCHGFIEAAFSSVFARGQTCPPPIEFKDVEAVVVAALRQAPPEWAAIIPATAAIRAAWPCPVAAPGEVALVVRKEVPMR